MMEMVYIQLKEKVRAIRKPHDLKNISKLRSFLGTVNYYVKFLPNLTTKLRPL